MKQRNNQWKSSFTSTPEGQTKSLQCDEQANSIPEHHTIVYHEFTSQGKTMNKGFYPYVSHAYVRHGVKIS
jgi:hypothetical protein